MKRLYFLAPDTASAKAIVNELLLARIEERHMHVLAKPGTPMESLPEASPMQKSDFVPATQRGLAMGGAAGTLAGLIAIALPPSNVVIAGGIVLASTLTGAGVGAWLGGMAGLSMDNTRHEHFKRAIAKGELLMMIDVPLSRVDEITGLIKQTHPEAEIKGTEPTIPAFP